MTSRIEQVGHLLVVALLQEGESISESLLAGEDRFEFGVQKGTDGLQDILLVLGLTKRVMECAFEEGNRIGDTRFVLTRYGNVVASTGSVLPVFRSQLAQFGEVRVTDPAMTRFWMRADEAVDCVLLALDSETPRGWIVVPPCGAMALGTLVALVAKPSEIRIVGLRAGERMDETLITDLESVRAVPVRDIDVWRLAPFAQISGALPNTWHYSSDKPREWWTGEQMLAAIADSEQV